MTVLEGTAHAKLNLTLDVLGKRPDHYHDVRMVMQEISLGDEIRLTLGTGQPWRVVSESREIPCDQRNLAAKAAILFFERTGVDCDGLTLELKKRTPVFAGMAGGSADGAAVLRLLYDHYNRPFSEKDLYMTAEKIGSDVPFGLFGGTALAEGKGQALTRLAPMPPCDIVLCKPSFPVSTPELYCAIDAEENLARPDTAAMLAAVEAGDLLKIGKQLKNVFEPVVGREHPEIQEIRETLLRYGAAGACMTGSGPTVFGLFAERAKAERACAALKTQYADTFLTNPV